MYKTVEKLLSSCVEAVFSLWGKLCIVHRPKYVAHIVKSYTQKTVRYAQFLVRIKTGREIPFFGFRKVYLPTQKQENIRPNRSSVVKLPVISPRCR